MNTAAEESKVVLVTGGSQRIGAAICRKFHQCGYNVIVHYNQSSTNAEALAQELNTTRHRSAATIPADLTDEQQVSTLAKEALECFGSLDTLVNNASGFYPTPFGSVTSAQWQQLMDSNLTAAFFLAQALTAALKKGNGTIVNLIDIYADKPLREYSTYSIAKAGLQAMTRALAIELAPNVRVNGVSPGAILWPENDSNNSSEKSQNNILKNTPLGKTGTAEDIAEAVFFLAADATYMTGEIIKVDGGRALNL
jgi:pteridine reductase